MKNWLLICLTTLLLLFFATQNASFSQGNAGAGSNQPSFFPQADLMKIGVFYYPEQWPKDQWQRDLNNIAKLGFEFTHFAEFAWTFIEPTEGTFDFTWLEEAIDLADKAGLKVILCTPSLTPPAWMGEKYPEIYLVGADGRRREHGIRANASLSNPVYTSKVELIVTELAKRFGRDDRIWGWQIDNEPLAVPDYSPSARKAFQDWLSGKYGVIAELNKVWGGSFWSTRYDRFDQVLIPNAALNEEDKLSPHALLDFQRFTADVTAGFLDMQARTLRKYIDPKQWITTNYVNAVYGADPRRAETLDFASFTMYPVNGTNFLGGNSFRTGNPYKIMESCDYFRTVNGATGVMELQPGQVNWAPINPMLQPGTVHMWLMQAFGGGCSFACTYRYRHPLFSSEMYHDGIVGTDGITLTQGGKEFVEAINDMKLLRSHYNPKAAMPERFARRRTALLWSHDVMWDLDIQPQTTQWDTWKLRNTYTSAIKSTGAPMDFIGEKDDFNKYPFMIAPAYQLIDEDLVVKWTEYVKQGGHLILTCRTGHKDKNGHFFEAPLAKPISSLIGADIEFFDMLPTGVSGNVKYGDAQFGWSCWGEILKPYAGTEVLAIYQDQYYAGKPAATTRKLGKGTVTFIGVVTLDGTLERRIVRDMYEKAGVEIEDLPPGIFMEWRDGFVTGVNYTENAYHFRIPDGKKEFIGSNPVAQGQAIIWQEY
ncbi:MAG: beta-galactosidase [Cyclobacteriaceae bacterium]|nr:beta-galactosidase [Cyclobacteriaceae bacterium]